MSLDRNFDDLAQRFQRKVYGGLKGRIRLAVLKKDLAEFYPQVLLAAGAAPLSILDAGSGHGPFSLELARLGHRVTLCDISKKMMEQASSLISEQGLNANVVLLNKAIQELQAEETGPYDLVLCHAVLEWVSKPVELIQYLLGYLKPQGFLSLTFYNLNGMIFKNLLRANYNKILKEDFTGWKGSLTPTYPRKPEEIISWLASHPLEILCHSGMRVFHDYILTPDHQDLNPEIVVELELKFSRQPPYRDLGRYQHILCKKT